MNPYTILNIPQNATVEVAKKAYKKLANTYHPDKPTGDTEKFKTIKQAYETIKKGPQRSPFEDLFANANYRPYKPQININAEISVKHAVLGGDKIIQVPTRQGRQFLTVNLPPNIYTNKVIQFDQGDLNLMVRFIVRDDKEWQIQHLDLHKTEEISVWDLMLGTQKEVQLIDGTKISIKVHPKTNPGTKLKLQNKGIHNGSLYITLKGVFPKTVSTEQHAEIIANL